MYEIYFYKDSKGNEPVLDYIRKLSEKKDKDSRIKLNKIQDYIQILSKYGIEAGGPYLKNLEDEIWELRPLRDRILFARFVKKSYILLHHFTKDTQKTPRREIEKAKRELINLRERNEIHE